MFVYVLSECQYVCLCFVLSCMCVCFVLYACRLYMLCLYVANKWQCFQSSSLLCILLMFTYLVRLVN